MSYKSFYGYLEKLNRTNMQFEDVIEILKLKGNKANLFTTIVKFPGLTASELHEQIGNIPKNKIYQLLDDLYSKELIYYTSLRPYRYWPADLSKVLDKKIDLYQDKIDEIGHIRSNIGKILSTLVEDNDKERTTRLVEGQIAVVETIMGSDEKIYTKLCNYINNADREVLFLGDFEDFIQGLRYGVGDSVEGLVGDGVKVRQIMNLSDNVISGKDSDKLNLLKTRLKRIEGRKNMFMANPSQLNLGIIIIDNILTGFLIKHPIALSLNFAVIVESSKLASDMIEFFNKLESYAYENIEEVVS